MRSTTMPRTGRNTSMPPRGNAPGRKKGRHGLMYWYAANVVRDVKGFPDTCIPLPVGASADEVGRLCREHTARLHKWIDDQNAPAEDAPRLITRYDGTVRSAVRIYQEHPYSRFHRVGNNTRTTYSEQLTILENECGLRRIARLTVLDVENWYNTWRQPAAPGGRERIDKAHDLVSMFKTVLRFNAALRHPSCKQLADELALVKFEKGGAREQEMTFAQVAAFIRKAMEMAQSGVLTAERARTMVIGVAAQFDLLLRQRDIIGAWEPTRRLGKIPPGQHVLEHGDRTWHGYLTWENIPAWRWRMRTSKSKYRAPADFDLQNHTLLFPLLEAVPLAERRGVIVKGDDGLPMTRHSYAKWFRKIARAAGIPDEVWNMDARAGGATEGYVDAEADLGLVQAGLTHANPNTTLRYIRRGSSRKIAKLADARRAARAADKKGS
jgi:hypothetical protein